MAMESLPPPEEAPLFTFEAGAGVGASVSALSFAEPSDPVVPLGTVLSFPGAEGWESPGLADPP